MSPKDPSYPFICTRECNLRKSPTVDPYNSLSELLTLSASGTGSLNGARFTVKDNIDVAGHRTSFGNPSWRDLSQVPIYNALCIDQLLAAGARCVGKAICDEFTYSLTGENPFFGTPVNARAPDRIPGGSSSGSAASVANGLADFSLATDSAGSIRVPASFCGLWGSRPSLGRVSEAGVLPFMPSVSTVGVLASEFSCMESVMRVILSSGARREQKVERLVALTDSFEIADESVRDASVAMLRKVGETLDLPVDTVSFGEIAGNELTLFDCNSHVLRNVQIAEFQNSLGSWLDDYEPELGRIFLNSYETVRAFDRRLALNSLQTRERLFARINSFLGSATIICFPTTPFVAPRKSSLTAQKENADFYSRTMATTSFAGIGKLPEISAPFLEVEGCPVGLSFAASHGSDEMLVSTLNRVVSALYAEC